jgi:hypothetical protein
VSRRLLRLEIGVFPDQALLCLHDPTADPAAPGGPPPPDGSLVSAGRELMLVRCAQEQIAVQLVVEEWDRSPPAFGDDYEDESKCRLYLRGMLSVGAGRGGLPVASLRLAGGVGYYCAHLYTRNRDELRRRYAVLLGRTDPLGDDFQEARRGLEGMEQYLIQFWRDD